MSVIEGTTKYSEDGIHCRIIVHIDVNGDAKKGGDGFTFGGNSTTPVLYQTQGTSQRNFGTVQITLKKGSSVVVTYQQYGLTSQEVYTGFQVYLSDTNL